MMWWCLGVPAILGLSPVSTKLPEGHPNAVEVVHDDYCAVNPVLYEEAGECDCGAE